MKKIIKLITLAVVVSFTFSVADVESIYLRVGIAIGAGLFALMMFRVAEQSKLYKELDKYEKSGEDK